MTRTMLVAGAGAIAQRHIRNVLDLDPGASITVLRRAPGPEDGALRERGVAVVYDLGDIALERLSAAILASPSPAHVGLALELARAEVPMLIEKPLSDTLDGVTTLIDECDRRGVVLMVGYNLRFRGSLRRLRAELYGGTIGVPQFARAEVGQYLPDWRIGRNYRTTVTAQRRLGGGALLELSHEIDYLRWLFGEVAEVRAWAGSLGDLEIDVEDTVEMVLRLETAVTASVHLDLIRRVPSRWCRVDGTNGSLVWDGIASSLQLLDTHGGRPRAVRTG